MTVPRRPITRWPADEKAEAIQMYADGKTIREIAEWFGRPTSSVWHLLTRAGIELRVTGRRKKVSA